jgi:hypothetical protein
LDVCCVSSWLWFVFNSSFYHGRAALVAEKSCLMQHGPEGPPISNTEWA